jgi:outer membrane receptor for ferrienterochelin and colicins
MGRGTSIIGCVGVHLAIPWVVLPVPAADLSRMHKYRLLAVILAPLISVPASAQRPDSGAVQITVEESMGMLAGFRVQAAGKTTGTDVTGKARLVLPVGRQTISVTRVGFKPAEVSVVVVRDSVVTARVAMAMGEMAMEMAAVKISATRTEKLAGETPIRVEVVEEMEVDEKTLMSPSGIGMLLNETPGIRVQAAAPGLGTGSVRILGLPGQYTVMLADGLPLYGGSASALGPLDISPVDLQRVEIIKGAASALYGGQSLGGVIDLISKPPTGKKELLLNRRMLGVSDAATWLSHRFSGGAGLSFLGAGTIQTAEDVDGDGWADQAEATRWSMRPRFHAVGQDGRSLFLTAGYGFDNRDGGTLGSARAPDGQLFREGLRSNRADVGATASIPRGSGNLAMRAAVSSNSRERTFGSGPRENDRNTTGFAELTRSWSTARATSVLGGALQLDDFENKLNRTWNHSWFTPALFLTTERNVGSLTLSASVRGDAHPEAGMQFTERFAVLTKPAEGWSVRGSVGTGFAAPSATTEETEAIGLRAIAPGAKLEPEKSVGAMLDINGKLVGAELLVTAYTSAVSRSIQLVDPDGVTGQVMLKNAAKDARIGGVEAVAVWRFEGGKLIGTYGYSKGSSPDAMTGVREEMPMLPRHRFGGDLMMEKEGVYRWGLEGIWYGEQALDDNPYRTKSKPYVYMMAIASRIFGPVEVVANFENLLNVRQTDSDPLIRRTPMRSGRWTTDVWAPLEGFMANVAIRYRWE